ncbi:MAG: 2-amino-4-hydroxy-6-hydroxymethyldihydropteridine diphosphokinase [Burkholderiales bacterium]|nr:2-amino-4-hydroxy-6-hydroxymethyldihydropteridine diphosphokinase [Burkholderiales bacterium]
MRSDTRETQRFNLAYLSLGSNIEPERNLPAAVSQLAQFGRVRAVSSVWETLPVGLSDQPNFLNAAVLIETHLSARALREEAIAAIEAALGRVRTENKNAPRTIDIDIMLFNHDIIQLERRRIPDPEVLERPFVAIPLADIAPDYVHPETGQTLKDIAGQFDTTSAGMNRRDDVKLVNGNVNKSLVFRGGLGRSRKIVVPSFIDFTVILVILGMI